MVLELFTSQGCSSCPPADRLLSRLGRADDGREVKLVPLAFHVDYWDYIGWTDPFSSADWSKRQQRYGSRFGLRTIYTPQLVINGSSECVGSDEEAVREKIAEARRRKASSRIEVRLKPTSGTDRLELEVSARIPAAATLEGVDAWVAVFENALTTPVSRGENADRTLRNDFVVRRREHAFSLPPEGAHRTTHSLTIALDPSWKPRNLGVAAFLQEPRSFRIHDATVAYLSELL
ncbi:MAG: DUF1223 domain-containing protein [Thermoanaerobaculia bacterium]